MFLQQTKRVRLGLAGRTSGAASAAENGEGQRALGAEDENLGVAGPNENRKSDRRTLSARSDAKKKLERSFDDHGTRNRAFLIQR
jgi:hypothetical protein